MKSGHDFVHPCNCHISFLAAFAPSDHISNPPPDATPRWRQWHPDGHRVKHRQPSRQQTHRRRRRLQLQRHRTVKKPRTSRKKKHRTCMQLTRPKISSKTEEKLSSKAEEKWASWIYGMIQIFFQITQVLQHPVSAHLCSYAFRLRVFLFGEFPDCSYILTNLPDNELISWCSCT